MSEQGVIKSRQWGSTAGPTHDAPEAAEIRQELARILTSSSFLNSPRLRNFLSFVVETTLAGKGQRVKAYTIAVEALGRGTHFDPQNDPIVRVEAGRLRGALAQHYAVEGREDPVVIELPRGGYGPTFRRQNPPLGLRKLPFSGRDEFSRVHTARRRSRLIILVAVVAFSVSAISDTALFVWQRLTTNRAAATSSRPGNANLPPPAILPELFIEPVNVSGTPSSDSMSSSVFYKRMIDAMTKFDDIALVADPSPSGTRPSRLSDYHLSSTIHYYSDSTANVAVSASDISDNSIIWSKAFRGWQHHVVPDQKGEMIREMTMALLQPFGVLASREAVKHAGANSMDDSYRCVLESHDYLRRFDLKRSAPVRACLEAAVERAPSWVSPYVQLARVNLREYQFGVVPQPGETLPQDRAFAAATRAVEIKPTSAAAYNVLQDVLVARGDLLGARKTGETAVQLNPYDRFVVVDHALVLAMLGETDEGFDLIRQITGDIPTLPSRLRFVSALIDYLHGDMKAALGETGEMITPLYPPTEMIRALVAAKLGDHATGRGALDRLYAAYPAWQTHPRDNLHRFLPDPGMVDRIVTDFTAATADLSQ